jgi:metal-sulfur cluster biosynthetic enzyme
MKQHEEGSAAPAGDTSTADGPVSGVAGSREDHDDSTAFIWAALGEVNDPELPVSLVDLGLIYAVRRDGGTVHIDLTFTVTACPCMEFIHEDIRERLLQEPGIDAIEIHVVWDPPWTVERMTAAGREALRRSGVAA